MRRWSAARLWPARTGRRPLVAATPKFRSSAVANLVEADGPPEFRSVG